MTNKRKVTFCNEVKEISTYIDQLSEVTAGQSLCVLIDQNVLNQYSVLDFSNVKVHEQISIGIDLQKPNRKIVFIQINANEKTKTLETYSKIIDKMVSKGVTRDFVMIGIGGGITTDIAGYISTTYMRGMKSLVLVPTTIMSQIDAAFGGKNGVNFKHSSGYYAKNMIGSFRLPDEIVICPQIVNTARKVEKTNSHSEILKYWLLSYANDALKDEFIVIDKYLNTGDLYTDYNESIIQACLKVKNWYIGNDVTDINDRRIFLNLGHTFAHAINSFKPEMSHGQTLWMALWILYCWAVFKGKNTEFTDAWWNIIIRVKSLDFVFNFKQQDFIEIVHHIVFDKKNTSDGVRLIFIDDTGKLSIVGNEALEELKPFIQYI